jgi:hypothetical protein
MALPEYRNLTEAELAWADHLAETGNFSGLRKMQELSASRGNGRVPNTYSAREVQAGRMPLVSDDDDY